MAAAVRAGLLLVALLAAAMSVEAAGARALLQDATAVQPGTVPGSVRVSLPPQVTTTDVPIEIPASELQRLTATPTKGSVPAATGGTQTPPPAALLPASGTTTTAPSNPAAQNTPGPMVLNTGGSGSSSPVVVVPSGAGGTPQVTQLPAGVAGGVPRVMMLTDKGLMPAGTGGSTVTTLTPERESTLQQQSLLGSKAALAELLAAKLGHGPAPQAAPVQVVTIPTAPTSTPAPTQLLANPTPAPGLPTTVGGGGLRLVSSNPIAISSPVKTFNPQKTFGKSIPQLLAAPTNLPDMKELGKLGLDMIKGLHPLLG